MKNKNKKQKLSKQTNKKNNEQIVMLSPSVKQECLESSGFDGKTFPPKDHA